MSTYIVSLMQKTSNDTFMTDKKPELSAAMKSKLEPKKFTKNPILGTKFTIAISSAKGGVGKSTFATNLALALKKVGCKVGLLDADIYGPSIPKMFDINEKPKSDGQKLDPITKYNIQCMSIGFLTDQQTPMIWRGPMVTSAIKTFTQKVNWKDLDFIIVDMPPGTGDTQLTFSQEIKMDGAIIVSTPQEVALLDVKRGIKMFDKLGVKILGLVDNMSFFIGDDGKKYKIFGEGTVKAAAETAMREVIAKSDIQPILTEGRSKIEVETQNIIQAILDDYESGIQITQVQTQKADPPDQVIDAFRDVQAARADMERSKNEAEAYANDVIPRARGEAKKILQAAEAYKKEVVAKAEGEASRFIAIYNEYKNAKAVTQERMYLETMEIVLADIDKVIIEKNAGSGVVPYLPLPELKKKATN